MDGRLREPALSPLDQEPAEDSGGAARLQQRLRILKVVLASLVLSLLVAIGFSVHVVRTAQSEAPKIIAEMTASRTLVAEQRLDARMSEARELTSQFYQFLAVLLESNPPVRSIRTHWSSISGQTASLAIDLSALTSEPLRATTRLYETGPTRVESILLSARQITTEMQALVPRLLQALRQARQAMGEEDGVVLVILSSLDELLLPFIDGDVALGKEWGQIKTRIQEWVERVTEDIVFVQQSIVAETLSEEFVERLWSEVF